MVENVANSVRSGSGTNAATIHSLGLGDALNNLEIGFCGYRINERGANIMKRLANTTDSDTIILLSQLEFMLTRQTQVN